MSSIAFDEESADIAQLNALLNKIAARDRSALSTAERMELVDRHVTVQRRRPALLHALINGLVGYASVEDLGGKLPRALAHKLRIRPGEARRLIEEATDLGERRTL